MLKIAALLMGTIAVLGVVATEGVAASSPTVRVIPISYRAHDGLLRRAYVIVPADYRPGTPIPLVISPHGRGVGARTNVRRWGLLPARGDFAVAIERLEDIAE